MHERSVHTLTKHLPDAKAKQPFNILCDVKADALMDTLTDTLSEAVAKTLGDTLGDVGAKVLV